VLFRVRLEAVDEPDHGVFGAEPAPTVERDKERLRVLAEAFSLGECVAEVCRRQDISTSLIFT
jgi:hypothetical protein